MSQKYRSPFLNEARNAIRLRHYSIGTEKSYVDWIKRFIRFNGKKHPAEMGEKEVVSFLAKSVVLRMCKDTPPEGMTYKLGEDFVGEKSPARLQNSKGHGK